MIRQAFKFKIYNSESNRRLNTQRVIAGQIWNYCIARHKRYYRRFGKHLHQNRLKKRVAYLRNHLQPEWKQLGSQAVQDVVERIERGYQLFFLAKKQKSNRKIAPPSFRKVSKYRSFTLKQAGWKLLDNNRVKIGKKVFRFHNSRDIEGTIKTLTIGRDAVGDYWLVFSTVRKENYPDRVATGRTAGFDFGLKQFLTGENSSFTMPEPLKQNLAKLTKANRNLSRRKRGSNGRKKAKRCLSLLHRRIANQRRDFHHKLARELAQTYDVICLEDLNIQGMKQRWGRKVSDLGFAEFVSILGHHCQKAGAKLIKVDRFFPSSKTCSGCGHINHSLNLRDRTWMCPECSSKIHRDKNAATNIRREGLRLHATQAGHCLQEKAA